MRYYIFIGFVVCLFFLALNDVHGQIDIDRYPIIIEAETGILGLEFDSLQEEDIQYITISTDFDETTGTTSYPGSNRTATMRQPFRILGYMIFLCGYLWEVIVAMMTVFFTVMALGKRIQLVETIGLNQMD